MAAPPDDARPVIRIGSRPSKLAIIQAELVQQRLESLFPTHAFELSSTVYSVAGDRDKTKPFRALSKTSTSLWTTELEDALVAGELDLLVHSMKDVPTTVREGCEIIPVLSREDATDCLVVKQGLSYTSLAELPAGSVVGTGSVRRVAQLKRRYPSLKFQDVRGNIDTRLAKLDAADGPYVAVVLASAGLLRLNLRSRITAFLHPPDVYPAVGQGILGAEVLRGSKAAELVRACEDFADGGWATRAERALLRVLEGGCAVPVGVWSDNVESNSDKKVLTLKLAAVLTSPDGEEEVEVEHSAVLTSTEDAESLGRAAAEDLMAKGGRKIMDDLRAEIEKLNAEAA